MHIENSSDRQRSEAGPGRRDVEVCAGCEGFRDSERRAMQSCM